MQIVVAVLPSIVLIALFFFFIFSPKNKELNTLNTRIIQLDREIVKSEEKVRKLDALIAENRVLRQKLERLKEQLPEEKEVSVLLKQLSELGQQSGLEILLWKPEARKTQSAGLYVEIPVSVKVMTEYHKLGDFFSHVSRLSRLVNIADIVMKANRKNSESGSGIIDVDFTARTFASVPQKSAAPGRAK